MDYENYDNDTNESDKDYWAFVHWLSDIAAVELRQAKNDPAQQKLALCRFYKRGEDAHLTAGELIDFLGVSSPSILDKAGYEEAQGDAIMLISDGLTAEDICRTQQEDDAHQPSLLFD